MIMNIAINRHKHRCTCCPWTYIHTQTHLSAMKKKRHLLCWHLLQSHRPPPLLHPSCHNCKNSTNTHTRTFAYSHSPTHTTFPAHTFSRSPRLSPVGAHVPTLGCSLHVKFMFVCVCRVFYCGGFQLRADVKSPPLDPKH